MMRTLIISSVLAVVALLAAIAGAPNLHAFDGAFVPHHVGGIALLDDRGARIVLGPSRNGSLIVLGYTRCPDECPATLSKVAAALAKLSAYRRPAAFFVTVDPLHDDPPTLYAYLAAWQHRIRGVTGAPSKLQALENAIGAHDPRSLYRDHDTRIFVLDPDGGVERELSPLAGVDDIRLAISSD